MTAARAPTDDQAPLLVDDDGTGIRRLILNRPSQRNGLSRDLMGRLSDALSEINDTPGVRVVVLAANGPAFCSGHDLKELTAARKENGGGRAFFAATMAQCSSLMQTIMGCSKPVIASVHGMATAAGCQLVASCDLAIAAEGAQFATPGVHIGLFCSTPMVALSRNVGSKQAMEMLLTGEPVSAARAAEIGLVNHAVADDELDDAVAGMAKKIAAKSSLTLAMGKAAFYRQRELPVARAYDYASRVMVENMLAADAEEGIDAFLTRRPPQWRDR